MRIGELAEQTGLPVDTIRFYEKKGLLNGNHLRRQDNNYRDYTEQAVARLTLIQQAKRLGFTLNEIQAEIDAWESNQLSIPEKVKRLESKILLIDEQIESLNRMKVYLRQKIDVVQGH
ncbi:MAG: MerR family transcriptional regulator [Elainellaceae cyanobacterium]